jgi:hypothetical protein
VAPAILHQLIGRALTDRRFRETLLRSPVEAIRDLPLTAQERNLIATLRATSLEDLSRKLDAYVGEPPTDEAVREGGDPYGRSLHHNQERPE